MENVTSTELQRDIGRVMSKAKREPVTVTNHGRPEFVICDAEEYKRLKEYDTRQALYAHELGNEWVDNLGDDSLVEKTPELDHLLK